LALVTVDGTTFGVGVIGVFSFCRLSQPKNKKMEQMVIKFFMQFVYYTLR